MNVTFDSGGQSIPTYVFSPSSSTNSALVILAYGSDGLVDNASGPWKTMIEGHANDLASKGFTAAIPDYFVRTGTQSGDLDPRNQILYAEKLLAHRQAWQSVLKDATTELVKPNIIPGINATRVGFIGYSLGGLLCVRAAKSVQALTIFFAPNFGDLGLNSPLILQAQIHHGEKDFLPYADHAVPIARQLTNNQASCHLWPAYPGAVHGFVGSDTANSDARRISKERMMSFFESALQ